MQIIHRTHGLHNVQIVYLILYLSLHVRQVGQCPSDGQPLIWRDFP